MRRKRVGPLMAEFGPKFRREWTCDLSIAVAKDLWERLANDCERDTVQIDLYFCSLLLEGMRPLDEEPGTATPCHLTVSVEVHSD
jgi:hypothetical protein